MTESSYRTTPQAIDTTPPGVPYIIGNEAAERFSFYGMKGILAVFMTQHIVDASGVSATFSEEEATTYIHAFVMAAYATPFFGAILSDGFLGKYKTILFLSCFYCLGHLGLALNDTRSGLLVGLGLIAIGSGGIKPCVSAHVGDQFGNRNAHLLSRVFGWFYISINIGAFVSMWLTPILLERYGAKVAFGTPGVFMGLATFVFWLGRNRFVHIPPGGRAFLQESSSGEGLRLLGRLFGIVLFVGMFWSLFDQTASRWVLQAESMNREVFGFSILSAQMQALNPLLIFLLVPLFAGCVYPLLHRSFGLSPLRKIGIGFFLAVLAFLVPAWVEYRIGLGENPTILWQVLAYVLLTAAEVMVSITCLEFFYTQAPRRMKSLVMSVYLLSVAIGNGFTALVNFLIQGEGDTSRLSGPSYYLFFSGAMLLTALLFIPYAQKFREHTYVQE